MLERFKKHPLSVLTLLTLVAALAQATFPEFPQVVFWAGKAQALLLGLSAILSGGYMAGKQVVRK